MKYYLIAGEASGDLHGSGVVEELIRQDHGAVIRAWGGERMEQAGARVVRHYRDLAFMGFVEVAKNIRTILDNLAFCKADILKFAPDALVLIDYPGFNLRIANWAKAKGIPVMYYISPQVWAWNVKRVHKINRDVTCMFTILPFEKEFYAAFGMEVTYVGHPLKNVIDRYRHRHPQKVDKQLIALLPGSRKQEISKMLPIFLQAITGFPHFRFCIARAPSIELSFYDSLLPRNTQQIELNDGDTYKLLNRAYAAITTSGTATLETALFRVPQVVCYKGNWISYLFAKKLIRVPFISLVNLIAGREVVRELIQSGLNQTSLREALNQIISTDRNRQITDYEEVRQKLEYEGSPPALVVKEIIHYLGQR